VAWTTVDGGLYHRQRRSSLGSVSCAGNESRLLDCPHEPVIIIDPGCASTHDVFVSCLCVHCSDHRPRDNLRLVDGSPVHGRLQVFSPRHKWTALCRSGWGIDNTRVACRQLGFLDGAGTYNSDDDDDEQPWRTLDGVSCVGNETSLFDCDYHKDMNCSLPVNILCRCNDCLELVQSPHERLAVTGSSIRFEWKLNGSAGGQFEFWFLSRKNRRLVLRRNDDVLAVENTELQHRIRLIGDNETTVGFTLANATRTDIGVYALHVPRLRLFNSQAMLFLTDFAAPSPPFDNI